MKNGFVFFVGIFAALGLSWAGIVLGSNSQVGGLTGYYDDSDGQSYPLRPSGEAAAGLLVYRDLGCASCHTQQVRRPGFGSDQARAWGERQSVARDYIYQTAVQLGDFRYGPDLANLATRKPTAPDRESLMRLLYTGQGAMPAYSFLFETRKISGQASDLALKLPAGLEPRKGRQVVPTARAERLVAYLLSLGTAYDYPEARPAPHAAKEGADK